MNAEIERIKAAHKSARPNPTANPAWANAEHDIGVLLSFIEAQAKAIEEMRGLLKRLADSAWANDGMPHEAVVDMQIVRDAEDFLSSHSKEGERG